MISNCVTVVHPIPFEKHIVKLNAVTGGNRQTSQSPKRGSFLMLFLSYTSLRRLLNTTTEYPAFACDTDEYRLENAPVKKRGRRRRSTTERFERIPIALRGSILICGQQDWQMLLPTKPPNRVYVGRTCRRGTNTSENGANSSSGAVKGRRRTSHREARKNELVRQQARTGVGMKPNCFGLQPNRIN